MFKTMKLIDWARHLSIIRIIFEFVDSRSENLTKYLQGVILSINTNV